MENSIQQLKMQGFSYEERFANFYLTDTLLDKSLTFLSNGDNLYLY